MLSSILLFLGNLGAPEIILVVLLVVFLFGGKKIPELARGLGKGIREFKDASREVRDEITRDSDKIASNNDSSQTVKRD